MDAANLPLKRTAILLAFALLIPAAAFAQTLTPSQSSIALSGATAQTESVTSSPNSITFSAMATYANGDPQWLCLNQTSTTQLTGLVATTSSMSTASFTITVDFCPGQNAILTATHNGGLYSATITLAATDGSLAPNVVIPVTYTVGSGGSGTSNGQLTVSQASINTGTLAYGSTYTTQIIVSTTSPSPISFGLSTSPTVTWVTNLAASTTTISSGNSATLSITLNGSGQSEAALSTNIVITSSEGNLSIPVTFDNGVNGSGGTVTTGSLTVSPNTIGWSYSTANLGAFPAASTVYVYSTNGSINYTYSTPSSGWLLVNGGFAGSGQAAVTPLTISPDSNLAALTPGTDSQSVTISGSDGSTATIIVTVTVSGTNSSQLTISPTTISLATALNGSAASATASVTSSVSGTLSATVTGSGISVSGSGQTVTAGVPVSLTIFGNPAGLSTGTYSGELTVSVAGNTSGAAITFAVGSSTTGTTTTPAPAQLYFYYEPNTSMQSSQSQQIYLSGTGNFTASAASATGWLSTLTAAGTLPSTIYVVANASGLASGTYTGQVTIANSSTGQSAEVTVTLLVQGVTTIYASPADWVFTYIASVSSVAQVQQFTVASSDGSGAAISAAVTNSSATPWLSVSGGGTTPFVTLTVATNASGLANGTYTGSITVTGGNNTVIIPIVLVVTGSSVSTGSGPLTLSNSALTLTPSVNGASVSTVLSVSASTNTTYTVSSTGTYNGITWLSVSPFGTLTTGANSSLTVTASPYNFPAGNYSGTISLSANGFTQTVQVTMEVGGTIVTGGSSVAVTANGGSSTSPTLSFTATSPTATVTPQYITVSSASGSSSAVFTVAPSVSTPSGGNWLSLTTTAGTQYSAPLTISVSINTTGLAGGSYTGQIVVTPVGGTAVTVPVNLTVAGAATITVSNATLNFSYAVGGATPALQTVPITVTNATSAGFTATATSTPSGWLVVTPTTGTAAAGSSLSVSIVTTGLAAGTYNGSIAVAGATGVSGSATIPVTLTVTVPLPTITVVENAASFVNGPIAPGEIITIGGTNIGPAVAVSFAVSNGFVGTTLGGVQVLINGYLAPLLYVSANQINAIVPYEIAGIPNPTVIVKTNVTSSTGILTSNGFGVTSAATAPGIFTYNGSGTGPGSILDSNGSTANATTAAAKGSVVSVYLTGEGQTSPQGVDGKVTVAAANPPYTPAPQLPITITVGGLATTYQFAGEAPGLVSGVLQLNVVIPSTLTATGNVPLVVSIGSNSSQTGVTVNVGAGSSVAAAGTNVSGATGSIAGLYPVSGDTITFSALPLVGAFTADFQILPTANPFQVVATVNVQNANSPLPNAIISINPASQTWQATYTVPTSASRNYSFSTAGFTVINFATGQPFPGNIFPPNVIDPVAAAAIGTLPLPTTSPATGANGTYSASGTLPSGGHFTISSGSNSQLTNFGSFTNLATVAGANTATFQLSVDGLVVASKSVPFTVE